MRDEGEGTRAPSLRHSPLNTSSSLQSEHVLHVVEPRLPAGDPESRPEGSAGKGVPARCLVGDLDALTKPSEEDCMLADNVPGTDCLYPDLPLVPLADEPLSRVNGHIVEVPPERIGDDLRHLEGRTARRIFLEPVVGLDDLDIIVVAG